MKLVPEGITRDQYKEQFAQLCDEELSLTMKKNNDYGGETDPWKNFREFGSDGIIVRMSDKWSRIKTALWEKRTFEVSDETIEDTLRDLAVYSKILILWLRDEKRIRELSQQNQQILNFGANSQTELEMPVLKKKKILVQEESNQGPDYKIEI